MLFLSTYCFSQISFEKGYYIDNTDNRIECLIKNDDWKNNPVDFECKLQDAGTEETKTIASIKEFGILGKSKYSRHKVDIDRASNILDELSTNRNSEFKEEELFLEVLVEGKATLFLYEDGSLRRFFYAMDDSNVNQLIHKEFKASDFKIGENNKYKQQLWQDLKCQDISKGNIELLNYSKNQLIKLFIKFNECSNSTYTNYNEKQSRDLFHLSIRTGVQASSLTIDNVLQDFRDFNFGSKIGFTLGLEAEFIMPFNKNKWALLIEPSYRNYESEKETDIVRNNRRIVGKVNYKSIESSIGIRHYFFLNEKSKLFLDGAVVLDLMQLDSRISINGFRSDIELKSSPNLAFGIGYKFNKKVSFEIRYHTSRDVVQNLGSYDSDYKTISAIIGYSIF
jgi:hypothetical protein